MRKLEFRISGEHIELHNLLKVTGVAQSGGAGKALVAEGGVKVDGRQELRKTCKLRPGQVVRVGDAEIRVLAPMAGAPK
jgi:ribosome-associated protein